MKKKLFSLFISAAVLLSGAGLAACNSTPAEHEHIWNDGEVTVQPSCKAEGVRTYACTVSGCKEVKTEPIGKTAHSWDGGKITEEASCTQTGLTTFTCGECGEKRTEPIDKTAHSYDGGTLTVVPTLTDKGEMTYECGDCADIKKESVAPRDDFAEHFYTSIAEATVWQYGYAEGYDGETGGFTFKRITETDEEQPSVWKADGVAIERNKIYSAGYAAIAYPVNGDMHLNVTASFTGDEAETRVAAGLSVVDADGNVKGSPVAIGGGEKDWNFSTDEEISVAAGDTLYMVFVNGGSGAPSGTFNFRLVAECRHMWGDGTITDPATCTQTGEMTYTCSLCGGTKTEEIPLTDHDFTGEWAEVEDGHTRTCAECGAEDTSSVVPHAFTEDEEKRVPATCHSDGIRTMVCADCGAVTTEAITGRPDHSLGEWQQAEGGHRKVCTSDGCGYEGEIQPHNMKDGEIIKEPTATEKGEKKSVCADCGYTEIIEIPTTDHTASDEYGKNNEYHWNICGAHTDCGEHVNQTPHDYKELTELREEPTCGEDGKSFWECVCGATKEEIISKDTVAHDFDGAEYVDDGDEGHHRICNVCGAAEAGVEHSYGEGEITTAPTFWAAGVKSLTCVCGHTEEAEIEKLNTIEHADEFTTENQDGNWNYGKINMSDWDNMLNNSMTQATAKNDGGDGWLVDGVEIKDRWMSAGTGAYVSFTAEEEVTIRVEITVTRLADMKRLDVRTQTDGETRAKYHGGYSDDGVLTIVEEYTLAKDGKLYMVFTAKGEDSGFEQGDYSIKISRV